ncbi:MAG: hypothetical protein HZC24_08660 [Rhodocyclales bacterium]|nr:hypothetical protein [Rhodocyclales bacterium]
MGKYVLLFLFGLLIYLVLTRNRRKRNAAAAPTAEAMIQCDYCRVHLPLSESLPAGEKRYCCEEHRRLGQG